MPSRFTTLLRISLALAFAFGGCEAAPKPSPSAQPPADQSQRTVPTPSNEAATPPADAVSTSRQAEPTSPPPEQPPGPTQPRYADVDWPHLKVDLNNKVVEIEGFSGIHKGWLEQIICLAGTRTHESVLITEAKPSHIHAALLLIGLEPGRPGLWKIDPDDPKGEKWIVEPPRGAAVSITVQWTDTQEQQHEVPIRQWVRDFHGHDLLPDEPWIFGGSMMKADYTGEVGYLADRTGSIAGLVTFGDELLGWCEVLPDQEAVMAPEWEANTEAMPEPFTPVTIRLRPASTQQ